jgi:hypothetical protein
MDKHTAVTVLRDAAPKSGVPDFGSQDADLANMRDQTALQDEREASFRHLALGVTAALFDERHCERSDAIQGCR